MPRGGPEKIDDRPSQIDGPPLPLKDDSSLRGVNSGAGWVANYDEGATQSAVLICGCVQQLPATQRVQELLITRGDWYSWIYLFRMLLRSDLTVVYLDTNQ